MTTVIAFAGEQFSGKSTAAKYIAKKYGAKIYSFATKLKQMCDEFIRHFTSLHGPESVYLVLGDEKKPYDASALYDEKWKEAWLCLAINSTDCLKLFTLRWFMRIVGTEMGRNYLGKDLWYVQTFKQIQADGAKLAVIDDCRFPNEAEWLHSMGAATIKLTRDDLPPATEGHESEMGISMINPEHIAATVSSHPSPEAEHLISELEEALAKVVSERPEIRRALNVGRI